jgi:hypothetical protein
MFAEPCEHLDDALNIYTHVVDASRRKAVETSKSDCSAIWPEVARSPRLGSKPTARKQQR